MRLPKLVIGLTLGIFALVVWSANVEGETISVSNKQNPPLSAEEIHFLFSQLERVHPPERLRELSTYGQRQLELGGGFYGMLPAQLAEADSIPIPEGHDDRMAASFLLARQRQDNLEALASLNPEYAIEFAGADLGAFIDHAESMEPRSTAPPINLNLVLDTSAVEGFFAALDDGEISLEEADSLASLPSNQAMLQHRRDLGYVPEPLPDTETLAALIRIAGSADPLDQIWCWINPQNAFDYADLRMNTNGYLVLLGELDLYGDRLVAFVLDRVARFAPPDTRFDATFALTVGWAIRGWVTPQMAGLNIEQTKDNWDFLVGTMIEETYHRLQLQLFPTRSGTPATDFSNLVAVDTGDPRYDRLFEIVTYTVAEGAANRVRGPFAAADLPDKVQAGADLIDRFIIEVVAGNDLSRADALLNEGLKGNGPLYGLGWQLAEIVVEHHGDQALGRLQQEGSVAFFKTAIELSALDGEALVSQEVVAAIDSLEVLLGQDVK